MLKVPTHRKRGASQRSLGEELQACWQSDGDRDGGGYIFVFFFVLLVLVLLLNIFFRLDAPCTSCVFICFFGCCLFCWLLLSFLLLLFVFPCFYFIIYLGMSMKKRRVCSIWFLSNTASELLAEERKKAKGKNKNKRKNREEGHCTPITSVPCFPAAI